MNILLSFLSLFRANITRIISPSENYFLATRKIKPLSRKFGFDRGKPIDRFWIESFLRTHCKDIQGTVLEIGDDRYTKQFGGNRICKSIILDLNPNNHKATVQSDLTDVKQIKSNSLDCIILTHVLGIIPRYNQAIHECYRMLKKGGVLLITCSCFSPVQSHSPSLWRFTPNGLAFILQKYFSQKNLTVSAYGNVLTGQCFWVGMSQEEITTEELEYNDPEYPVIAVARAIK